MATYRIPVFFEVECADMQDAIDTIADALAGSPLEVDPEIVEIRYVLMGGPDEIETIAD